jgi:hypothetical protein
MQVTGGWNKGPVVVVVGGLLLLMLLEREGSFVGAR